MDYMKFIENRVGILKDFLKLDFEEEYILEILKEELEKGTITKVELSNYKILKNKINWEDYGKIEEEERYFYEEEGE